MKIRNKLSLFQMGLEDLENGVAAKEKEYVWYGKFTDTAALQKAIATERQTQATIKTDSGTIRVRRVLDAGVQRFVLTAKERTKLGECLEVSQSSSEDMYKVFCAIAGEVMDKMRYTFDGPNGTKFELDLFLDKNGVVQEWCKVDWEVPETVTEFPPLPFTLQEMIFGGNDKYTAEQSKKVGELYSKVFCYKV